MIYLLLSHSISTINIRYVSYLLHPRRVTEKTKSNEVYTKQFFIYNNMNALISTQMSGIKLTIEQLIRTTISSSVQLLTAIFKHARHSSINQRKSFSTKLSVLLNPSYYSISYINNVIKNPKLTLFW